MPELLVEIWSDIACPWCYVGKRRLEAGLAGVPERDAVEVVWRAFELDRAAPRAHPEGVSYAQRLARKYGTSVEEGQAMIDRMTSVAAGDGLDFRFDRIRPGNTFDAHRLLAFARERGTQGALKERFLRGYMTEGEPIGDPAALARMALEAGLAADEVRRVLGGDAYAREVRDDEEEAERLGIHAVPFFVLGRRFAVSGAQPVEFLRDALRRAMAEVGPEVVAEGAACGAEGCE